jgi:hypothetical protein
MLPILAATTGSLLQLWHNLSSFSSRRRRIDANAFFYQPLPAANLLSDRRLIEYSAVHANEIHRAVVLVNLENRKAIHGFRKRFSVPKLARNSG